MKKHFRLVVTPTLFVLMLMLAACTQHIPYRTNYDLCVSALKNATSGHAQNCDSNALQQQAVEGGASYLLGFIEFDDQGQLWSRKQMNAVIDKLWAESASKDLLMVVFVHGWQHNAAPDDKNIATFQKVLAQLSADEKRLSEVSGKPARQVAGVYLGWRGESITVPLVKNITFWDRKSTAEKVGHGGVTEVLSRLEQIKTTKDSIQANNATRLVVVGHSFGGAIVHTALAQVLALRNIQTTGPAGTASDVKGFGSLVVLMNPAFEAGQFTPLSDMSVERGKDGYFKSQLPVIAILTSEADYATRFAFPAGRRLSTLFENTHPGQRYNGVTKQDETISQDKANVTAVGHFGPYRTHKLYPQQQLLRSSVEEPSSEKSVRSAIAAAAAWENDAQGSKISMADLTLERTSTSAGRNPYLVIQVDRNLIEDHNDIDDPRIIDFVKQLIFISTLPNDAQEKQSLYRKFGVSVPAR